MPHWSLASAEAPMQKFKKWHRITLRCSDIPQVPMQKNCSTGFLPESMEVVSAFSFWDLLHLLVQIMWSQWHNWEVSNALGCHPERGGTMTPTTTSCSLQRHEATPCAQLKASARSALFLWQLEELTGNIIPFSFQGAMLGCWKLCMAPPILGGTGCNFQEVTEVTSAIWPGWLAQGGLVPRTATG